MNKVLSLRVATAIDAEKISSIYKPYVEKTAISFEYIPPDAKEIESRIASKTRNYPFIVAEYNGEIAGYAYASPFLSRPAYIHSVETSVYVDMSSNRNSQQILVKMNTFLKGKSSIIIHQRHGNLKYKYGNRSFWCRGYYVDTAGKNAKRIEEYIKNQLKEDMIHDQMTLRGWEDPFTGSK